MMRPVFANASGKAREVAATVAAEEDSVVEVGPVPAGAQVEEVRVVAALVAVDPAEVQEEVPAAGAVEEAGVVRAAGRAGLPVWVSNLLAFGFIFAAVIGYFLWQARVTREAFIDRIKEASVLVANIIELSAKGALLSQQVSEELLQTFLGNTARFIVYLDAIEPFTADELTGFAREASLAGIYIMRPGGTVVEGPAAWTKTLSLQPEKKPRLQYHAPSHLYLLHWPDPDKGGWVLVGVEAARIEALQKELGLDNVVATITRLPGIKYIKTAPAMKSAVQAGQALQVALVGTGAAAVAEAKMTVGETGLTVGLDAAHLEAAMSRLWRDFIAFSASVACLGVVLSLLLYRQQAKHVGQIRAFEQKIADERQNTALGKAAAAIAHEIRNPLNALSMGLQRLQKEAPALSDEHLRLLGIMRDAVRRTNDIVGDLLRFAVPRALARQPVRLDRSVEKMLQLYEARCRQQGIAVELEAGQTRPVSGDPDLIEQVIENLLKNALEAQPRGGFVKISITSQGHEVRLAMTNGGFCLSREAADQLTEPYFTGKAGGTGLGLSIVRRIVQEHGGAITISPADGGVLSVAVTFPAELTGVAPA
jgi:signal transduction histidine kinase